MPYKTKAEKNANARCYYQEHKEKFAALREKTKEQQREYMKSYYKKHRKKLKKRTMDRYYQMKKDDPEALRLLKQRERDIAHFGHTREEVFAVKGNKCLRCGKKAISIHHMDRNGRNYYNAKKQPGTDINRLEPLCRRCHRLEHNQELLDARMKFYSSWWSPKHKLKRCLMCKSSKWEHYGHGYCVKCYHKWKAKTKQEPGV